MDKTALFAQLAFVTVLLYGTAHLIKTTEFKLAFRVGYIVTGSALTLVSLLFVGGIVQFFIFVLDAMQIATRSM